MIDLKEINNQPYLLGLIKKINQSDAPILDISDLSQDQKSKVISAYTKFKFALDSSGTPIKVSLLTERITDAPKEIALSLDETPFEITDKIEETPPKKKKKDD